MAWALFSPANEADITSYDLVGTQPHITKTGTINFKPKSNTQGETVGLGVTFSGRMPLVIDMTLTGSLNWVLRRQVKEETVGAARNFN